MMRFAVLAFSAASAPALANPFLIEAQAPEYTTTFALRYWYGMGSTGKDLYDNSGSLLVSSLTYGDLRTHSAEAYFRLDHSSTLFWKGYVGGGFLTSGNLNDEDFAPVTVPYSSTMSTQSNSQALSYISTDIGGALFRGADFRIDGFVGYHYLNEKMQAFGCRQIASNPGICVPAIADSVPVIGQQNTWQALRLGLAADIPLFDRVRLSIEGAWLPYVWMNGSDSHYLRIGSGFGQFTGPIPEDGTGTGYQFEAIVSYKLDDHFDLAIGGRYWHMQTSGYTHFEGHVVGVAASPQAVNWKTDHYGVFLQGSYKFGLL
jgi:hypothetical protein